YDDPNIVLGQSTAAFEVLEAHPEIATFLVPIGGGGMRAGTSVTTSRMKPDARVVGVEPEGAAKLSAALAAGHPVPLERTASIARGLLRVSLGALRWARSGRRVRRAFTISDAAIGGAVDFLFRHQGLKLEPSGAV